MLINKSRGAKPSPLLGQAQRCCAGKRQHPLAGGRFLPTGNLNGGLTPRRLGKPHHRKDARIPFSRAVVKCCQLHLPGPGNAGAGRWGEARGPAVLAVGLGRLQDQGLEKFAQLERKTELGARLCTISVLFSLFAVSTQKEPREPQVTLTRQETDIPSDAAPKDRQTSGSSPSLHLVINLPRERTVEEEEKEDCFLLAAVLQR